MKLTCLVVATPDNRRKAPAASSAAGEGSSPITNGAATHAQTGGAMGHFIDAGAVEACLAGPSDSGHFVRRSVDARVEDPFVEKDVSDDAMEASSLHRRTQSTTDLVRSEGAMVYSPRADRASQQVTTANAQGVFLPEACVFVAK
jgi:hypothetical protein